MLLIGVTTKGILEDKIYYYSQDPAENEYMSTRIQKNANIRKENEQDVYIRFAMFARFNDFYSIIETLFEFFLADPERRKQSQFF